MAPAAAALSSTIASSPLAVLIFLALCALVAVLTVPTWRRRRHGPRRRRRLGRTAVDQAGAPARRPRARDPNPAADREPPNEASGLPTSVAGATPSAQPSAVTEAPSGAAPPVPAPTIAQRSPEPRRPPPVQAPGRRLSDETLAPLAQRVDRSRRLVTCEARVALKLSELPRERWAVDSYVLVGGHRVPFLVLGATGVFAIWPLDGTAHPLDPEHFADAAQVIHGLLAGYAGQVHVGICRPIDPGMQPRWHLAPPARAGAWMMGVDWLIPWMEHFGTEHGLGVDDIARYNALAGPHWNRRITGVPLPSRPSAG
jgi:hypothetical protein